MRNLIAIMMLIKKPTHDNDLASALGITRRQASNIRRELGAIQIRNGYWMVSPSADLVELAQVINLAVKRELEGFDYEGYYE